MTGRGAVARQRHRDSIAIVWIGLVVSGSVLGVALPGLVQAPQVTCAPKDHAPILIRSDRDFTSANGVVSGAGTASDPFLIANVKLNDLSPGYGLKVDNSRGAVTKFFNVQCVQSSFSVAPPKGAKVIWIVKVHQATTIADVSANSGFAAGSTGIQLDGSSYVTLDNISINKFGFDGVQINGSDRITILNSKLKAMHNGVTVRDSHDISMGAPCNLSALDSNCNEFTYDDGWGLRITNSHHIQVQYTKTNADDTGGTLLEGSGTFAIILTNGIANAEGAICPEGVPTGEKTDYTAGIAVINGAHDINVKGYTINGNFHDIMNGGNGEYFNPCTGLIETFKKMTPPGGSNLDFNGNCYHIQFGFDPEPTRSC